MEFPAGITAIVGPNGSGKSNIIDAIRWLLGEREAKNLRGGKGEDLIFAGTPKRPRTGLAEAGLHFDNHNKFFPVDFAEISVTRRIARDGESEYFLNKSEVRLKDIIDFFAAARLGSRGLTVVTQGNSDMVLRASPEERREMIEEALGLKEYQIKKHESERRLKNAQINLDKAQALLEEILPHLRSLKRQTSRWEKRGEYAEELRELENRYFGAQFRKMEEDLRKAEGELRAHEAKRGELGKRKDAAEKRLAEAEANEPKERAELKDIKSALKELDSRRGALERDLAKLEAKLEVAGGGAETPQADKLWALVRNAKIILSEALGDPAALQGAVKRVLSAIENVLAGAPAKSSGGGELRQDLNKISGELKGLEAKIAGLRSREKILEQSQEEFYAVFKAVLAEVQSARDALDEWTRAEQQKTLEHERTLMRKDELEHRITEAGRRAEEFKSANSQLPIANSSENPAETEKRMFRLRGELAAMGEADEAVINEARATEERYNFLERESADLRKAEADLKGLIKDLNQKIRTKFDSALVRINEEFQKFFELMFGGGTARLVLEKREARSEEQAEESETGEPENVSVRRNADLDEPQAEKEPGLEIKVSLPRKRISSLDMLSGGERSLVGIATLFALISVSPPPFLVLDEIDAALDERNARRFAEMLKDFSKETQFIVVTHNRSTMEAADVLYGVTLDGDGTSKILSMRFADAAAKVG